MSNKTVTLHRPPPRFMSTQRQARVTVIVMVIFIVAIFIAGNLLGDYARQTDFTNKSQPPSGEHIFGTDWMGRDVFARAVAGLSTSLRIGLIAAIVSGAIALLMGTIAGLGPRWADSAVNFLINLVLGIPHLLLLILISVALGRGVTGVTVGIALTHWASLARVIRAEILAARESTYVAASRSLGHGPWTIARRHMFPVVAPQFLIGTVLIFPHAILHESAITFLGFGLPPEQPAIGVTLAESLPYLGAGLWWTAVFPGLVLVLVAMAFGLLAESLRKLIDPRTKRL